MKLRSAKDIITVAKKRGFEVLVNPGPPPMPFLRGNPINATDPLMQALRAWRLEIIEELTQQAKE
jgi:hypothetical protein